MSTTLFLKYRPQTFGDLVGQESIVRTLQNALKSNRPAHAYLFVGSRGTGKTSTARIFSKGLNCLSLKDGAPCGECDICKSTADGSLVDVIEIDAASHTGVDNIRDLREKANFMPNMAKRKIYIIDEVHMLSKGAFNALLKTLEEPPSHAFFILATTEFDKVPETIVSRCQTFTFGRFSIEQLVERIEYICKEEHFETNRAALELIARKAEGGLRDAIGLLEQLSAETEGKFDEESVRSSLGISSADQLESFYSALDQKNVDAAFSVLKDINQRGGDFRSFGHDFLNFLREKMYNSLSNKQALSQLIDQIEAIEHALTRFRTSPLVELPLEIAVLKLCSCPVSQITEEIPASQPSIQPAPSLTKEKKEIPQKKEASDFVFDDTPSLNTEKTITPPATFKKEEQKEESRVHTSNELTPARITEEIKSVIETTGFPTFAKKSLLMMKPQIEGKKICFIADAQFHVDQLQRAKIELKLQHSLSEKLGISIEGISFRAKNQSPLQKANEEETKATVDDLQF
jgi:DNA polymerase III subunit gamma/tau